MKDSTQLSLFDNNLNKPEKENEFLWRRFIQLGEMIGDGLHHESDGKWISREYKKLSKILVPKFKEFEASNRRKINKSIDLQMANLIETRNCKCGGKLKQSRSGSKTAYCQICNQRYVAKKKK